jgi:hypothetical protein
MKNYLLITLLIIYTVWTWRFITKFNKSDTYFDKAQKLFHTILIWLVPFIWIMIIKMIIKPTLGGDYSKKDEDTFYESGMGEKLV